MGIDSILKNIHYIIGSIGSIALGFWLYLKGRKDVKEKIEKKALQEAADTLEKYARESNRIDATKKKIYKEIDAANIDEKAKKYSDLFSSDPISVQSENNDNK